MAPATGRVCFERPEARCTTLRITVRTLAGKKIVLRADENDPVAKFQKLIEQLQGTPVELQDILLTNRAGRENANNTRMTAGHCLREYCLSIDDEVLLVRKLPPRPPCKPPLFSERRRRLAKKLVMENVQSEKKIITSSDGHHCASLQMHELSRQLAPELEKHDRNPARPDEALAEATPMPTCVLTPAVPVQQAQPAESVREVVAEVVSPGDTGGSAIIPVEAVKVHCSRGSVGTAEVEARDLGSDFYLKEADVSAGRSRAQVPSSPQPDPEPQEDMVNTSAATGHGCAAPPVPTQRCLAPKEDKHECPIQVPAWHPGATVAVAQPVPRADGGGIAQHGQGSGTPRTMTPRTPATPAPPAPMVWPPVSAKVPLVRQQVAKADVPLISTARFQVAPPNSGTVRVQPSARIRRADLETIGRLGVGAFGIVTLEADRRTGRTYALKAVSKGYLTHLKMVHSVLNEKHILKMVDSPFVIRLLATYNGREHVYFLLEAALGGELFTTYERLRLYGSEVHARFYVGCVAEALSHLHQLNVIYRDLKPENLLLDVRGYCKITDMGLAKVSTTPTFTLVGTPDYMAPEVINGTGQTRAVDWWMLGVLLYELLVGRPPFEADSTERIYELIRKGIESVVIPPECRPLAADLVRALCNKDPERRSTLPEIWRNLWFHGFDWDSLRALRLTPPYIPAVCGPRDLSNFRACDTEDPPLLHYVPDGSGWDRDFEDDRLQVQTATAHPSNDAVRAEGHAATPATPAPPPWASFPATAPMPSKPGVANSREACWPRIMPASGGC